MRTLIRPLAGIAAVGLLVSIYVHVSAWIGVAMTPLAAWMLALHLTAILLAFPMIVAGHLIAGDPMDVAYLSSSDVHLVLQACSPAMRGVIYGFAGYAMVNFAFFAWQIASGAHVDDAATLRGFSGHWMAFFAAEMAIMWTYVTRATTVARCPNGHPVSPNANFCEICGQPVARGPA